MACYGVYFSGRLKKKFKTKKAADKFAQKSFEETRVKLIVVKRLLDTRCRKK